jgi:hypothetical protein
MSHPYPILNFPDFSLRIREMEGYAEIFDTVRKKYVRLTPEEWVRQHMVHYLIHCKRVPESLIAVEKKLLLYRMKKRTDILVFDNAANPLLIVECKAPEITLDSKVFDQIVRYNLPLRVRHLVVTNGFIHYCCRIDPGISSYRFLDEIPPYNEL